MKEKGAKLKKVTKKENENIFIHSKSLILLMIKFKIINLILKIKNCH